LMSVSKSEEVWPALVRASFMATMIAGLVGIVKVVTVT